MLLIQFFIHILKKGLYLLRCKLIFIFMDITNNKFEKFESEDNHDSVTPTTYKRKIFGRQKTLSETSIYNPIDPQERKKSRQNSFADKTLDCITQCFWQCSSCYQCNEKS
ncbi:PREDICTED: uncharacterized protein LOC107167426 [Diuraphis noxia]|uniref:uncharacterized protein LOC107167426 n=1 Tax=Diuraphis noxia TaxID=143948 RepID=UPI00076375E1|nr:PREDICTED: uncharacterized protein LOC107167426 [Diuraphis noxia]